MNKTLMGLALCGTLMLSIGVVVASQSPISMASMTRGYAATSADYNNDFYCRTKVNDTEYYLTYASADKKMVEGNLANAVYTIDFTSTSTATLKIGETFLGWSSGTSFNTNEYEWNVHDGALYNQDNSRLIMYQGGSVNAARVYAVDNIGKANYFPVYFYTQDEFDAASSRCNWADNNRRTTLSNLAYDENSGGGETPVDPDPTPTEGTTSTLTFSAACGGSGTADNGVVWTVTSDAAESTYDSDKGVHYGTSKKAVSNLTLTTSGISGTIKTIKVNASGASSTSAVLNVTVGGVAFDAEKSLTATATEYTLTGSATGTIVVNITQSSAKKALYCKSIVVIYE